MKAKAQAQRLSGRIVDLHRREVFPGTVEWAGGRITAVRRDERVKATRLIMPGLVDAHIHIESSLLPPSEFARLAVIHGTVATVSDPHEIANVLGEAGVRYMLAANDLNGKCADINALFVALARASGIPARDAYGLRVADSQLGYKSLGKSGDVTRAQHCRAEFYASGYGWVPVDPADVRKVMLEESPGDLPITDPKVRAARVMMFGAWEMNWVAYNHGHDVALPGAQHGPVPFLMYPNGETSDGRLDTLDPDSFRYRITARQLAA